MAASLYRPAAICERNGAAWAYVKKKRKKQGMKPKVFIVVKKFSTASIATLVWMVRML